MAQPFELAPSLWAATAPPAPQTPPLDGDATCDVCVVGGGYAGLSTALHLAERGVPTILLEAKEPGWGGSGRNGGQVIPGLKHDPDELVAMFGPEAGERIARWAGATVDCVFDLIDRHGMDVPRVRKGWIQGAHTPVGLDLVKKRAGQWAARGVQGARVLDATEAQSMIGTDKYLGGWIDPRGGTIQPLAYARGLAAAAIKAGARIHGQSPVARLSRKGDRWRVETATVKARTGATVTARRVVLCTNGYTGLVADLVPGLRQTVVAPNSYQVATAPLSSNLARSILPGGQFVSDTRQLLFYFRLDHQNRLLMGGRGPLREPTSDADWAHLVRVADKMFPQVKDVPIAHRWCGRVAVTRDFLPHLHEPEPGLLIDIGCMGRGVGLQSAMGKAMAGYLATGSRAELPFPIVPVKPLPLHALHKLYLSAIVAWYRLQDGGVA